MPQPYNNAIITNQGASLLTRAQAGECTIGIVKIAVGTGTYTDDEKNVESLQQQTRLKDLKNEYALSDITVYDEHTVKVTALITNQDPVTGEILVDEGYYINEIGLYAKANDEEPILYSIAVTSGSNGDFMPPYNGYNPVQITQDYYATVGNATEVTINTSGAALLVEDANVIRDDTTKRKFKLGIDNGKLYYTEVTD